MVLGVVGNITVIVITRALERFTPPAVVALAAGLAAVVATLAGMLP